MASGREEDCFTVLLGTFRLGFFSLSFYTTDAKVATTMSISLLNSILNFLCCLQSPHVPSQLFTLHQTAHTSIHSGAAPGGLPQKLYAPLCYKLCTTLEIEIRAQKKNKESRNIQS